MVKSNKNRGKESSPPWKRERLFKCLPLQQHKQTTKRTMAESMSSIQLIDALKDGKTDVAQDLLNDETTTIDVNVKDNDGGSTALHFAAVLANIDITKLLLNHGADVNAVDQTGLTALHVASDIGKTDLVQLLLANGANIQSKTNTGATPLHQAAFAGRTNVVKMLLEHGAHVNDRESHGWCPLHWAARQGHAKVVDLLLENGANVTAQDNFLWTPLHYASGNGNVEAAYALLDHGADLTIQNQDFKSPLDVAPDNPTETALRIHKALQGTRQRLQRLDAIQKQGTVELETKRLEQLQQQTLVDQQQQHDIAILVDKNTVMNQKLEQIMQQNKVDANTMMQENRNYIDALRIENQQQASDMMSHKANLDETIIGIQNRLDEISLRCNMIEIVLIALMCWYLITSHRNNNNNNNNTNNKESISSDGKMKKDQEEQQQPSCTGSTYRVQDAQQQLRMRNNSPPSSGKQND